MKSMISKRYHPGPRDYRGRQRCRCRVCRLSKLRSRIYADRSHGSGGRDVPRTRETYNALDDQDSEAWPNFILHCPVQRLYRIARWSVSHASAKEWARACDCCQSAWIFKRRVSFDFYAHPQNEQCQRCGRGVLYESCNGVF